MSAMLRAMRRAVLAALTVLGPLVGAQAFEPYVVIGPRAELYDGTRPTSAQVLPGDLLAGRPDAANPGWLIVLFQGRAYQTRASALRRLPDLEATYRRRRSDLDGRLQELNRRLADAEDRIAQLQAAALAVRFDATVQYRYRQVVPVIPDAAVSHSPGPAVSYLDHYEDRIAPARARALAESWDRERARLEDDLERWREERREQPRARVDLDAQQADVTRRFLVFRVQGEVSAEEPYLCRRPRTPLYKDQRLVGELDAETVVRARVHRTAASWLKVVWGDDHVEARREAFWDRLTLERELGGRLAWLEQAQRDADEAIQALTTRRQALEAVGLALDYAANLEYLELRTRPFPYDYRGRSYYRPPLRPSAATEVVNQARARRLARDCEDDLQAITRRLQRWEADQRTWRREAATLGPRLDALRRRFDAAP